jgi:hypothetical protein
LVAEEFIELRKAYIRFKMPHTFTFRLETMRASVVFLFAFLALTSVAAIAAEEVSGYVNTAGCLAFAVRSEPMKTVAVVSIVG